MWIICLNQRDMDDIYAFQGMNLDLIEETVEDYEIPITPIKPYVQCLRSPALRISAGTQVGPSEIHTREDSEILTTIIITKRI